jgi:Fe-S-cluster containining protein
MNQDPESVREARFSTACMRCGECCTRYQVLLDEFEVEQVAGFLGITTEKLKTEYTDPRWPVPGKFLLKHRDKGGCIFLVYQGKQALCSIHMAKPKACRDWTPALSRKECSMGLARVWGLAANENGDLCGAESDIKAFTEYMNSISS